MYLWPFTNLIFTDDTASTDQHHAIYRRTQKKWGCNTPPPPIATPLLVHQWLTAKKLNSNHEKNWVYAHWV